ncbi:hypothetical protein A3K42_00060 [candidate division WWE3 bacterium RBG_13_37_7]|uniref:NodB homology domain-containing protein n=1 Tax=candidate division WWE3 bacterium RBG_13_37_7 TaxID=1802609 RepID=A0A1F4U1Y0_UNCKA|nr:MAG: hypothetical protein A3K42_00060 [candidate division WWE3 bacterium RBG_13_37_7]
MYTPSGPVGGLLRLCIGRPIFFIVPVIVALVVGGSFDLFGISNTKQDLAGNYYPYKCGGLPISYAFDDGYQNVYEEALPVIEKVNREYSLNLTATAYVTVNLIGSEGHMSLDQLKKLSGKGWEIGSHSLTHPNLLALSAQDQQNEIAGSRKWLEERGFKVFSFASPYGELGPSALDIVKKSYYAHRTNVEGLNDIPLKDPAKDLYELKTVFYEGDMKFDKIQAWVDKAFAEGKYLIISFHRVTNKDKVSVDEKPYTTDIKDFEKLTEYIISKSKDYKVVCSNGMPTDLPGLPLK